jgi:hypothetical protein
VYHHQFSRALAEAHMQDRSGAARSGGQPRARVAVLAVIAIAALGASAARAQPAHDIDSTPHRTVSAQQPDGRQRAAPSSITSTNPLHRFRGVGAGGGQL